MTKKGFIIPAVFCACLVFMIPASFAAPKLLRFIAIIYDETHFDPVSFNNADVISGPLVGVHVAPLQGVTLDKVKAIHTRSDGHEATYSIHPVYCQEDSAADRSGPVWYLPIKYWTWTTGEWKIKAWDADGNLEKHTYTIDEYGFPPKPTNISWWEDDDGIHIEWDASVGSPEMQNLTGSKYRISSRGTEEVCSCTSQARYHAQETDYDPVRNRVKVVIPSYHKGCILRINNVIEYGGALELWDPETHESTGVLPYSRSQVRIIIP